MTNEWKHLLENCKLCPVECGANRLENAGACGVSGLHIAKYYLHPFEEPCISFKNGSGTVFFTGCNLRCAFCQNYEVSRAERGKAITPQELADIFKALEAMGAENVSLVTPSHLIAYLLPAFEIYKPKIPVVYNSSGYEKIDALKRIDPFIDIYLPDMKFYSPTLSKRYLGKENYFDVASEAVEFMANSKPLKMTDDGKMLSGCIVRHLVMPLCTADTKAILKWFKRSLPSDTYLSLMSQYTPMSALPYPELTEKLPKSAYLRAVSHAQELGFKYLYTQDGESASESFIPEFK